MGLEIKLSDSQIRPSAEFLNFLSRFAAGETFNEDWFDQLNERLRPSDRSRLIERAESLAGAPLDNPLIQQAYLRSYQLTTAILLGDTAVLRPVQERFRLILVVGCPRSGGSYLTRQLYLAFGMAPESVPGVLAHDGYPKAWPFYLAEGHNGHTDMTRYMAEYLVMVELFFGNRFLHEGRIVVPKKDLNAAYHGAFYNRVLGPRVDYIWTIRHPVTCCISTYEKSGGLPSDGRHTVRGNSEGFIRRDNLFTGVTPESLRDTNYFDAYLRYWEQYHYNLVLTGMAAQHPVTIVPYTEGAMRECAQSFMDRSHPPRQAEAFFTFDKRDRHLQWVPKAEAAIRRVAEVWRSLGFKFPVEEVMEAW